MKNYDKMSDSQLDEALRSLQAADKTALSDQQNDDLASVVHNLEVHQLELEVQNRELMETRHELEVSRNGYLNLYDFAPTGYMTLDEKGCVREMNLTGAAMLGRDRTRLIGKPFVVFVTPSDAGRFLDHINRCQKTTDKVVTDLSLEVRGGRSIYVQLQSIPVEGNERREHRRILCRTAITDISERKAMEQAMRDSEERARALLDAIPDLMFRTSSDGTCLDFRIDKTSRQKISPEEVIGRSILDVGLPAGTAEKSLEYIQLALETGRAQVFEYSISAADGIRHYEARVVASGDDEVVVIARDITNYKRAEAALVESKEQLASVIGAITDGIITTNEDLLIIVFNRAAESLFRCSAAEAIGQPIERFIPGCFNAAYRDDGHALDKTTVKPDPTGSRRLTIGRRADGEEFPLEASISQVEVGAKKLYTIIHRESTEAPKPASA
jgi:PAS domain S-box-containing protein